MMAYRHRGFWQPADTIKERTALEAAYQSGTRPWMLWDAPTVTRCRPPSRSCRVSSSARNRVVRRLC